MKIVDKNGLKISSALFEFINNEAIPGTDIKPDEFWKKFAKVVSDLTPINKDLINQREILQKKIDDWHKLNKGKDFNKQEYVRFLKTISYLVDEKDDFKIETSNIDQEISSIPGPQLVVPVDNARYAINAANARWGSLYDSLYGTDVIPGKKFKEYNAERASKVINYVRKFLDDCVPMQGGSWKEISKILVEEKKLVLLEALKKTI